MHWESSQTHLPQKWVPVRRVLVHGDSRERRFVLSVASELRTCERIVCRGTCKSCGLVAAIRFHIVRTTRNRALRLIMRFRRAPQRICTDYDASAHPRFDRLKTRRTEEFPN